MPIRGDNTSPGGIPDCADGERDHEQRERDPGTSAVCLQSGNQLLDGCSQGRAAFEQEPFIVGYDRKGPPREADLTSHMDTTRSLCTLSGPTNRSIPDRKMVTERANGVPAAGGPPPPRTLAHISGMSGSRGARID